MDIWLLHTHTYWAFSKINVGVARSNFGRVLCCRQVCDVRHHGLGSAAPHNTLTDTVHIGVKNLCQRRRQFTMQSRQWHGYIGIVLHLHSLVCFGAMQTMQGLAYLGIVFCAFVPDAA